MSSASKAKGTLHERNVAEYFQSNGIDARRLPRMGAKDIGDHEVPLGNGVFLIVEAKDEKRISLPDYLRQASVESENYASKYPLTKRVHGCAIVKARNANISKAFVVFDFESFIEFLQMEVL